jgi:hypothetical protein
MVLIMVTAKARLPQNGVDGFIFQQFPDYYFASVNLLF